jgi:hypothetical protein
VAGLGTRYDQRALINTGTFVSFVIESYLLLAFAGLIIRFVEGFLSTRPAAPDTAFAFALPVAAAGFWVFVLWRRVLELGWGWLPEIRL